MNKYFYIGLFLASTLIAAGKESNNSLEKIRQTYYAAVENKNYVDSLAILIENNYGDSTQSYSPTILSYYAGIEALKAKHSFWPFNKLKHLSKSMKIFGKAIDASPQNLEIRFMRYSILYYVPGILGYSDDKDEDREMIIKLFRNNNSFNLDSEIVQGIVEFMIMADELREKEENFLKEKYNIPVAYE